MQWIYLYSHIHWTLSSVLAGLINKSLFLVHHPALKYVIQMTFFDLVDFIKVLKIIISKKSFWYFPKSVQSSFRLSRNITLHFTQRSCQTQLQQQQDLMIRNSFILFSHNFFHSVIVGLLCEFLFFFSLMKKSMK